MTLCSQAYARTSPWSVRLLSRPYPGGKKEKSFCGGYSRNNTVCEVIQYAREYIFSNKHTVWPFIGRSRTRRARIYLACPIQPSTSIRPDAQERAICPHMSRATVSIVCGLLPYSAEDGDHLYILLGRTISSRGWPSGWSTVRPTIQSCSGSDAVWVSRDVGDSVHERYVLRTFLSLLTCSLRAPRFS